MSSIDQQTTADPKFLGSCCGAVILDCRTAFTSSPALSRAANSVQTALRTPATGQL